MTRTRRKRIRAVPGAVGPTPERISKAQGLDHLAEATSGGMLKRTGAVRLWSALENLYRNRLITAVQRDAGEKFYADWFIGYHAASQITMRWSDYVSGFGAGDNQTMDAAERRVFHVRRFQDASKLLDTFDIRKPVHWLVINDIHPQDIGRRFRGYRGKDKAASAGTTTVAIGLQALAKFYGLIK